MSPTPIATTPYIPERSLSGRPLSPTREEPELETIPKPKALVIVDPVSSGAMLALLAQQRGYKMIALYSNGLEDELIRMVPQPCKAAGLKFDYILKDKGDLQDTVKRVIKVGQNLDIKQVMVGCESGVELYDALADAMGMPGNGTELSEARRNKYLMGERVRQAGLRAVRQLMTDKWEEACRFVEELGQKSMKIVLKPISSAGSDGVYFASTMEEARQAFDSIIGTRNVFGEANTSVLVQEFLKGTEYVVDSVSHQGHHRVCAFWKYDKRATNGSAFVYYGLRLFQSEEGKIEQALADYSFGCLSALGIENGFSHAEVMWLDDENVPCLIEVGARPHGGEGARPHGCEGTFVTLTAEPLGYNQLTVSLDLIEDPSKFHALPPVPPRLKAHAAEACLVSRATGLLVKHLPGVDEIYRMQSFRHMEMHVPVGSKIRKTIDMLTSPGSALLSHHDLEILEREYELIHQLDLFHIDESVEEEGSTSAESISSVSSVVSSTSDDEEEGERRGFTAAQM